MLFTRWQHPALGNWTRFDVIHQVAAPCSGEWGEVG